MDNAKLLQDLINLEWGNQIDWKPRFITYSIVKRKSGMLEINDCSGDWLTAIVSIDTMEKILNGEIDLINLNWK